MYCAVIKTKGVVSVSSYMSVLSVSSDICFKMGFLFNALITAPSSNLLESVFCDTSGALGIEVKIEVICIKLGKKGM